MRFWLKRGLWLFGLLLFLSACGKSVQAKEALAEEEVLKEEPLAVQKGFYIISQDGTGDFSTIQSAVDFAEDGAWLIILPGVYEEWVKIEGKSLHLFGMDPELCILEYPGGYYKQAPLMLSGGTVENLTIYARGLEEEEQDPLYAGYSAYAVHIDSDELYGQSLSFQNCRFISDGNACVGIGTRGNSSIRFTDCSFTGAGLCLFVHDSGKPEFGGDCYLTFLDCALESLGSTYAVALHSIAPTNANYFTFLNVTLSMWEGESPIDNEAELRESFGENYRLVDGILAWNHNEELLGDGFLGLYAAYLTQYSTGNLWEVVNVEYWENGENEAIDQIGQQQEEEAPDSLPQLEKAQGIY